MRLGRVNLRKIISVFVASSILTLSLTSYASTDASAVNESMSYTVFYATGDPDGSAWEAGESYNGYTLAPNTVVDNSRGVIGTDERESDNRLPAVVRINGRVTGFIVDAHTIATAAHCVFDCSENNMGSFSNTNKPINLIEIIDENGIVVEAITDAYDVHIPNMFITKVTNGQNATPYDYAMITVSQDLSEYANLNLGATTNNIIGSSLPVYVTGFPQDLGSTKYTGMGYTVNNTSYSTDRQFLYNADTKGGNSGSPVYTYSEYGGNKYYTVIGIHTGAYDSSSNFAVRMTTELLHFYKNNPNIDY